MRQASTPDGQGHAGSPPEHPLSWRGAALRWLLVLPVTALGFVAGGLFNALRFGDGSEAGPGLTLLVSGIGSVVGVALGCAVAPRGRACVGAVAGVLIAGGAVALLVAGGGRDPRVGWGLAGAGLGGLVAAVWAWLADGVIDIR